MSEILDTAFAFNVYDRTVDTSLAFSIAPAAPTLASVPFLFDIEGFTQILAVQTGGLVRRRMFVRRTGEWVDP